MVNNYLMQLNEEEEDEEELKNCLRAKDIVIVLIRELLYTRIHKFQAFPIGLVSELVLLLLFIGSVFPLLRPSSLPGCIGKAGKRGRKNMKMASSQMLAIEI